MDESFAGDNMVVMICKWYSSTDVNASANLGGKYYFSVKLILPFLAFPWPYSLGHSFVERNNSDLSIPLSLTAFPINCSTPYLLAVSMCL